MKNFEQDFTLPPFPAFPSASRYVPFGPVQDAVARISRSINAREAISLMIGPPGTGKSLACSLLAKQFAPSHAVVAIGETTINDETAFYRFVLRRLGVAIENATRDDLELLIHDRLCGSEANENGAVLIVDEAASLSTNVLEAIRRLTNLMRDGQPVVSVVVAGGVKLDDTLTAPSMESFVQRVTARCYLHPFNGEETRRYIRDSIQACDASPNETITDMAISAIHHATSGVPRLINQLMTEAIDCAAEMDETLIDEHTVNKAWASLQQLPGPMMDEPKMKGESSIVEFGELIDPLPISKQPTAASKFQSEIVAESISRAEQEADADLGFADESLSEIDLAPAAERTTEVTDPVSLFGIFDDEEQIEIGASKAKTMPSESSSLELESMLHSQIVGLSQFASENTSARYSDYEPLSVMEAPTGRRNVDGSKDDRGKRNDSNGPSVVWYDEPADHDEASGADGEYAELRDDTDLLWITEDIDVERRAEIQSAVSDRRVDLPKSTDAPKLSVDYREILEKMRNQA
ncbi:MAG: AAA family ATPase [Planctomycetales bacterium]|nr:AAA family ATPase [Planctomycetales bacterium]